MSKNTYLRSYAAQHTANAGKQEEVIKLFEPYNKARNTATIWLMQRMFAGQKWTGLLSSADMPVGFGLTARQYKDATYDVQRNIVQTADEVVYKKLRRLITKSTASDEKKHMMHAINKAGAWFQGEFYYKPAGVKKKVPVDSGVHEALAGAARKVFQENPVRMDYSDSRSITLSNTVDLEEPVIELETGEIKMHADMWLKVSKFAERGTVTIPLHTHDHARDAVGEWSNFVRLTVDDLEEPNAFKTTIHKEAPNSAMRQEGRVVGCDFGLSGHIFALDDGSLLAQNLYEWLKAIDEELEALTVELQKEDKKLKNNKRYNVFRNRISAHVTGEINRILNKLADQDIKELVVEKLDFRGGGLSRQLNRILSNAGRAAVRKKLASLKETHGIEITEVNPAYTSQECSSCGFVHRLNRSGRLFNCRFCRLKLHADVNAARVIRSRRSTAGELLDASKEEVLEYLDEIFTDRWGLSPDEVVRRHDLPSRLRPSKKDSSKRDHAHAVELVKADPEALGNALQSHSGGSLMQENAKQHYAQTANIVHGMIEPGIEDEIHQVLMASERKFVA